MDDLAEELSEAREDVQVSWTPDRARLVHRDVVRSVRRRAQARAAIYVVVAACVVGGVGWWLGQESVPMATGVPSETAVDPNTRLPAEDPMVVELADGSTATRLSDETLLEVTTDSEHGTEIRLNRGAARFEVTRSESRRFRVSVDGMAVEVLGTRFVVERVGSAMRVDVERGRVRVLGPFASAELGAGDEGLFPPAEETPPVLGESTPEHQDVEPGAPVPSRWRHHAQRGEYGRAYHALERAGADAVRNTPQDLLLAADVARLSGHPARALSPLRRLVRRHRRDPRAPLAAFTLGRVLLDELGRPREAAAAFAQARALSPRGSLVEDALAREAEAFWRAGDEPKAREIAGLYLARYPNGRRASSVRRYGSLE